jgi:hypothetical protein
MDRVKKKLILLTEMWKCDIVFILWAWYTLAAEYTNHTPQKREGRK